MTDTRPDYCCGKCPPINGGGYDCTCKGNPRCEKDRLMIGRDRAADDGLTEAALRVLLDKAERSLNWWRVAAIMLGSALLLGMLGLILLGMREVLE